MSADEKINSVAEVSAPVMAGHTPTPWTSEVPSGRGSWIGNNGVWAALSYGNSNEEAAANAAFIVHACNSHDALLAALKAAQEHVGLVRLQRGFDIEPIRQQVAAAIALADPSSK